MCRHFLLRLEEPNNQNGHLPPPLNEMAAIVQFALENPRHHSWLMTIGYIGAEFEPAGTNWALVTFRPMDNNVAYLLVGRIVRNSVATLPGGLNGSVLGDLYVPTHQMAEEKGQMCGFWELEMPICLTYNGAFISHLPVAAANIPTIDVKLVPGVSQEGNIAFPDLMGQQHSFVWNLGGGRPEYDLAIQWRQLSEDAYFPYPVAPPT